MADDTTVGESERQPSPAQSMQRAARRALYECRRAVRASDRSVRIRAAVLQGQARRENHRADGGKKRAREAAIERIDRLRPRELESWGNGSSSLAASLEALASGSELQPRSSPPGEVQHRDRLLR